MYKINHAISEFITEEICVSQYNAIREILLTGFPKGTTKETNNDNQMKNRIGMWHIKLKDNETIERDY